MMTMGPCWLMAKVLTLEALCKYIMICLCVRFLYVFSSSMIARKVVNPIEEEAGETEVPGLAGLC